MRDLIPQHFYRFNYPRLIVSIGVTLAVAFIVYTALFGSVW